MQPTLGDFLRKVREKSGKNQTEFGKEVGIVVNTLSAYERSERLPDLDLLIRVSIKFGADLTEMIRLRVFESADVEIENEHILTFFNQIRKYPNAPNYANFLAKEQIKTNQLAKSNANEGQIFSEISNNQFKICYQVYYDFYQLTQPNTLELTNISNVVGIYNLIIKLYPILGLNHDNFKSLEPLDVTKIMDALSALGKIPNKNDNQNLIIE